MTHTVGRAPVPHTPRVPGPPVPGFLVPPALSLAPVTATPQPPALPLSRARAHARGAGRCVRGGRARAGRPSAVRGGRAARGAERGRARRRRGVSCGASGGRARTQRAPSLRPQHPAGPAAQRPPPHRGQLSAPSVSAPRVLAAARGSTGGGPRWRSCPPGGGLGRDEAVSGCPARGFSSREGGGGACECGGWRCGGGCPGGAVSAAAPQRSGSVLTGKVDVRGWASPPRVPELLFHGRDGGKSRPQRFAANCCLIRDRILHRSGYKYRQHQKEALICRLIICAWKCFGESGSLWRSCSFEKR